MGTGGEPKRGGARGRRSAPGDQTSGRRAAGTASLHTQGERVGGGYRG